MVRIKHGAPGRGARRKLRKKRAGRQAIHKAKDNSFKSIFGEHELFAEFLRDFIGIDMLKGVGPADIEDITERFLPLFQDGKDADTVKRVNLKGDTPLFVIAIVEHESEVNHRAAFKMLQYITLVLTDYEKETNKAKGNVSRTKGFKFPPVLPVIFYDGAGKWTAERCMLEKTEMGEAFRKYVPKFEYELVDLNDYSESDLAKFGDTLSLVMIIDKLKTADGIGMLRGLPEGYAEQLALKVPDHLKKLISDVVRVLLARINVPGGEIDGIIEKIDNRRFNEMFAFIEEYDVQETRRLARREGKLEGRLEGKLEGRLEGKLESAISIIKEFNATVAKAMEVAGLSGGDRERLVCELERRGIPYEG